MIFLYYLYFEFPISIRNRKVKDSGSCSQMTPSCKSSISVFYLGNFQQKALIINILLSLRKSAYSYAYALVKTSNGNKNANATKQKI